MMKSNIRRLMPRFLIDTIRKAYWRSIDALNFILGRRGDLIPPKRLIFVGGGDFKEIGDEFLNYFVELGHLQPDNKVLDIGCGIGRMAIPLTRYLTAAGAYEGFDVVAYGIDWCQKKITSKFPNFHFYVVDLYNKSYNQQGKQKASTYRFQYEDESFDFIFATSLFTHTFLTDTENYIAEAARTLKQGGRCLITFYLLNPEAQQLIDAKRSILNFAFKSDGCHIEDKSNPGFAIAYEEGLIRGLYEQHGLKIVEPIHLGAWCGRGDTLSHQDIIVAVKGR